MNVGAMRERVVIQIPSSSAASNGEYGTPTWRDVVSVFAEVVPLSARERLQSQALQQTVTYRVILRDRSDVTPKARIVCEGPDYFGSTMQVHAVVRDHRNGSMELDCSEVTA